MEFSPAPGLWLTFCDPNQLETVLLSLAINARDAMPSGGKLVIGTRNTEFDAVVSRYLDQNPGEYVCMTVADTGSGMTPEVTARAFDPFFTTKPIGQGTGLGLSMVYGFAKQSGGHVRIDSAPGQGATVELYLPRHAGSAVDTGAATRAGTQQKGEAEPRTQAELPLPIEERACPGPDPGVGVRAGGVERDEAEANTRCNRD